MPTRRPRKTIDINDVTGDIDEVMSMLITMKNDNRSYDMIAEDLTSDQVKISAPLVRKVALGLCRSPKIEMALGLREMKVTVPIYMVRKRPPRNGQVKRRRFTCDMSNEEIARFDAQRGKASRADWLVRLMDLMDDHLEGVWEII